jgi:hypothetical protein
MRQQTPHTGCYPNLNHKFDGSKNFIEFSRKGKKKVTLNTKKYLSLQIKIKNKIKNKAI